MKKKIKIGLSLLAGSVVISTTAVTLVVPIEIMLKSIANYTKDSEEIIKISATQLKSGDLIKSFKFDDKITDLTKEKMFMFWFNDTDPITSADHIRVYVDKTDLANHRVGYTNGDWSDKKVMFNAGIWHETILDFSPDRFTFTSCWEYIADGMYPDDYDFVRSSMEMIKDSILWNSVLVEVVV